MTTEKKGCLAFAVCGSFCTLEDALGAAQALTAQGWTLLPVMSFAAQQDTRFGTGESWRQRLQAVTGQPVLDTLQAVETKAFCISGLQKDVEAATKDRNVIGQDAVGGLVTSYIFDTPPEETGSLEIRPLSLQEFFIQMVGHKGGSRR